MERHGWITPLPNGMKACCGGPGICPICQAEQRLQTLVDAAQALKDARRAPVFDGPDVHPQQRPKPGLQDAGCRPPMRTQATLHPQHAVIDLHAARPPVPQRVRGHEGHLATAAAEIGGGWRHLGQGSGRGSVGGSPSMVLVHGGEQGRRHGLVALQRILHQPHIDIARQEILIKFTGRAKPFFIGEENRVGISGCDPSFGHLLKGGIRGGRK
mgnify:CR=1 FL=1